jgi:hypothetical protein
MISVIQQQRLLLNVSKELDKPINAYAIGGTAMMFLGFKDATLDIDVVFDNEENKETFKKAAKKLGYKEMDAIKIYGVKRNTPDMLKINDERFDLFVNEVIDFIFSDKMKERAKQMHQFGDNLILKIANPHDIILMKCATERIKDKDDARSIIENTDIDWDIIIGEAKNQIRLGKERAAFDLGGFLEDLAKELKEKIPKKVLDELYEIVKEQAEKKQKENKN